MVIEIFVMANAAETQIKKNNDIVFLKDLPTGLKRKLATSLKMLKVSQILVNTGNVEKSILVLVGRNKILSEIEGEIKAKTEEALKLLSWYFGQHFFSYNPGLIGADVYCSDCKSIQFPGHGNYCENPHCPSHALWKQVIGASYKLPKKLKTPVHILPEMSPEQKKEFKKNLAEIKKTIKPERTKSARTVGTNVISLNLPATEC